MAEEAPKRKINFNKIALFGLGPIVLLGVGLGAGAFLFMPTQTPVEQVEALIEKKLKQAGQLPSEDGLNEEDLEPQKVSKETPVNETFVTSYYTFADNFTTNLNQSKQFLQISVGVSTQYDETVDDIDGKVGRDKLANSIKDAINVKLEELEGFGGVEGVHFTSFVLQ